MVLAPSLGLDPDSLKSLLMRSMPAGGGGRWRAQRDSAMAGKPQGLTKADSTGGHGRHHGGGNLSGAGARANRAQVVFVRTASAIEPRIVRLGLSDFDWSEVLSGVREGEEVVLLGITQAQASRSQQQSQIRQRVGTMPGGIGGTGGGGGGGGGAGGGGGGRRGPN
jgi:HlyD family secretion protein